MQKVDNTAESVRIFLIVKHRVSPAAEQIPREKVIMSVITIIVIRFNG